VGSIPSRVNASNFSTRGCKKNQLGTLSQGNSNLMIVFLVKISHLTNSKILVKKSKKDSVTKK